MLKRTKTEKTKLLANFVLDVVYRCTAEINQTHARYADDAAEKKNKLSHTKHALVSCYMRNHEMAENIL